ncbi:MAG: hypothetical protein ACOYNN_13660 [Terrimicrobiaceae bacterium]
MKKLTIGLIGAALLFFSQGCCVTTSSVHPLPDGNVRRLLQSYPLEADKARVTAPAFTRDALKTISGLEEQVLALDVSPGP